MRACCSDLVGTHVDVEGQLGQRGPIERLAEGRQHLLQRLLVPAQLLQHLRVKPVSAISNKKDIKEEYEVNFLILIGN